MVVALQIVCVSAVFCGALHAAPTVTYDQRQQGEFNVQVDVDDVAIILLASEEFAQRAMLQGNKLQQIFGRHSGVKSKKKHHKKPVDCSTMATANPEVPYSSESPPTYLPTSSQELYPTSGQDTVQGVVPAAAVAPVSESVPVGLDGQKNIASHASYSEATTPSAAQNAFEKNVDSAEIAASDVAVVNSSEMVAVEDPAVGATAETNSVTEKAAIATADKSADVATTLQASSEMANDGSKADIKTYEILSTNFEEKPVSISSDVKTVEKITNDETVKINDAPVKNTEDKSYETTTVKTVETVEIGEAKPAEMVAIKTIEKPTTDSAISDGFVGEPAVDASRVNVLDSQVDTKTTNEPTEMIAVKPVEKPTFSEVLKVVKKPVDAADTVKAADTQTSIKTSVDLSESPTEMVAMKTIENPQTAAVGLTDTIEKSGITTSTKLVGVQEDTKKQSIPSVENIVSRSASKQTEMVAVKTMENSATVKSVISVKTVIKPGIQKSTHSSNSSLIMRKVGDRKPLPTITLEVATPKVL